MFYATTIKSVTTGGAVDVNGRSLQFIGYLPVKAGDTVFTDGKYIFGNAPPKGAPAIFDEQSGIPISATTVPPRHSDLRGYFTPKGKFKSYRVAGDDWLVNDKKSFKHDTESDIIDAEISDDGALYTVEKKITRLAADDTDYHWGFYQQETTSIFAPINFGRIAVHVPGDNFYNSDIRGFQSMLQADGSVRFFYRNIGGSITSSYDDGFYWAFRNAEAGLGINMATCYFFLKSRTLDYSLADNQVIKKCEFLIRNDNEIFQTVSVADLLTPFEDAAQAEVDVFPNRESIKHVKSRAIVHNFKILSDSSFEFLLEAEIWASNTFYNETEERDHSTDPPTIITTPFHISSTVSHNHLLLKFKSDGSHEKIWTWKFLYPLKLRDSSFGQYYDTEPETSAFEDGAWIVRTMKATAGVVNGVQRWYTKIWRDYDSRRELNSLKYDTPIKESADKFYFPVQDDFYALIKFAAIDEQYLAITHFPPDNVGEFFWNFGGVYDVDDRQVVGDILSDETDAHKWNMSFVTLKGGGSLFGIHDGKLYKIGSDGTTELVGDGLKNFRLRELKKISKAKK